MEKTYSLYIGSDNVTKKLDKEKIEFIMNAFYNGYTLQEVTGYWKGERENTALVTVVSKEKKLMKILDKMKEELNQEAIAWQEVPQLHFS